MTRFYLNANTPLHPSGPYPLAQGWLYLAYDYRHLDLTKIGITTRPLFQRIREATTNPWYALFAGFYVPDYAALNRIENYIGRALHTTFVDHLSSRESEWCTTSPADALSIMVEELPNVMNIECDEGEYDFTKTIYLPEVNPYEASLGGEHLHEYVEQSYFRPPLERQWHGTKSCRGMALPVRGLKSGDLMADNGTSGQSTSRLILWTMPIMPNFQS